MVFPLGLKIILFVSHKFITVVLCGNFPANASFPIEKRNSAIFFSAYTHNTCPKLHHIHINPRPFVLPHLYIVFLLRRYFRLHNEFYNLSNYAENGCSNRNNVCCLLVLSCCCRLYLLFFVSLLFTYSQNHLPVRSLVI